MNTPTTSGVAFPTTEAELRQWISSGVEEGLTVEYKRAASLSRNSAERMELSKDVSAMANSAGGLLFYGVSEFPKGSGKEHLPADIDPIIDPTITKEWLQQVINTGIRPRLLELEIAPIRVVQPTPGVIFVLVISQGGTVHQADDRWYYRRFNFLNEPMFDHEIRDVMGRAKHPIIKLSARLSNGPAQEIIPQRQPKPIYRWLHLGLFNEGTKMAQHVRAFVSIPLKLLAFPIKEVGASFRTIENQDFAEYVLSNHIVEGRDLLALSKKIDGPLLPGLSLNSRTVALVGPDKPISDEEILVHIFADEAPPRFDVISLGDLEKRTKQLGDEES